VTAVPSPTGTPVPSLTATETETVVPSPTSSPTPEFDWSIYFEYAFGENYWKVGENFYKMTVDCPDKKYLGDYDGRVIKFTVSETADIWPSEEILLIIEGFWLHGPRPQTLNPQQKTRMFFGYGGLSLEQAIEGKLGCHVNATINNEVEVELLPSEPTSNYWGYVLIRPK